MAEPAGGMPFTIPGAETLPPSILYIGAAIYAGLIAWNAASAFINSKKQVKAAIASASSSAPAAPADMIVTGASLADRASMTQLAESIESLALALNAAVGDKGLLMATLGPKGSLVDFLGELHKSMDQLAKVYQKRVDMDEREMREEEIKRRVEAELSRRGNH